MLVLVLGVALAVPKGVPKEKPPVLAAGALSKKKKSNMFRPIHSSTISAKFQTNKRLTLCYGYSTHRLTTRILSKKIHRVLNFYIENLNGDKCFTDGW